MITHYRIKINKQGEVFEQHANEYEIMDENKDYLVLGDNEYTTLSKGTGTYLIHAGINHVNVSCNDRDNKTIQDLLGFISIRVYSTKARSETQDDINKALSAFIEDKFSVFEKFGNFSVKLKGVSNDNARSA